jgi:hypothetical protein
MMLRASLERKVQAYIPYEAGRKIPINERVEYYMQKLEAAEEDKKEKDKGGKRL